MSIRWKFCVFFFNLIAFSRTEKTNGICSWRTLCIRTLQQTVSPSCVLDFGGDRVYRDLGLSDPTGHSPDHRNLHRRLEHFPIIRHQPAPPHDHPLLGYPMGGASTASGRERGRAGSRLRLLGKCSSVPILKFVRLPSPSVSIGMLRINVMLAFQLYASYPVHEILGVRATPYLFGGRADSQDRMDQVHFYPGKVDKKLTMPNRRNFEIGTLADRQLDRALPSPPNRASMVKQYSPVPVARIVNEVKGINRLIYEVISKPPRTTERE